MRAHHRLPQLLSDPALSSLVERIAFFMYLEDELNVILHTCDGSTARLLSESSASLRTCVGSNFFWFSDRATFQSLFNLRDLRILQIVDLPYQPGLRALFVPPECHRPTAIHYKELTVRVARVHNRVFCIPDIRYGSTISSSDHYCVCLFRCTLSLCT